MGETGGKRAWEGLGNALLNMFSPNCHCQIEHLCLNAVEGGEPVNPVQKSSYTSSAIQWRLSQNKRLKHIMRVSKRFMHGQKGQRPPEQSTMNRQGPVKEFLPGQKEEEKNV